ncbi:MAG TPA: acetyl-CoA C-acetyltransferase [Vicinamibacterales bacterium]|nr:acetyl-CoA C-acetyltransferase [Vicinamibacterales bacterium]
MDAVIVSAVRTATGKFLGSLKPFSAPQLGAIAIREAVARAGIDPAIVEECIMGNVVSAGLGQAPARQAALRGGLSNDVAALTINKVCGSGLKAVMLAAQAIGVGDTEVIVAGGMESMSNCPYLLERAREGLRMGHGQVIDSMISDGLWCSFEQCHMGNAGEVVASEYHIDRECQDRYAVESHRRAAAATAEGRFNAEILPVQVPQKKGAPIVIDRDESIRPDASMETLGALKAAFKKDGTVTAGNAPPVNDGAAALVVMSADRAARLNVAPMARIVGQATSGLAPKYVLMTPVEAVRRLVKKIGWRLEDVDLVELNEAFAVQAIAVLRDLGLDAARVNVNGGAVALGHPIGASGARVLTTLLHALEARQLRRGIATLCLGGGNGVALAVERN